LNLKVSIFGLDATITPTWSPLNIYTLIPILSAATALLMTLYSEHLRRQSSVETAPTGNGGLTFMLLLGPVMSLVIGFSFPTGINFYWTIRNVFSVIQEYVLNKFMPQKDLVDKAREEMQQNRAKANGKVKKTDRIIKEGENVTAEAEVVISDKEYRRRKLAEARRKSAEKYGEEYVEVNDDDLE
jgi:YidC/Oxa1 family membrane protein insertase